MPNHQITWSDYLPPQTPHLAVELGVLIEGVVELLGTLLQTQGQRGLGAAHLLSVPQVPLLKQRAHVFHYSNT